MLIADMCQTTSTSKRAWLVVIAYSLSCSDTAKEPNLKTILLVWVPVVVVFVFARLTEFWMSGRIRVRVVGPDSFKKMTVYSICKCYLFKRDLGKVGFLSF